METTRLLFFQIHQQPVSLFDHAIIHSHVPCFVCSLALGLGTTANSAVGDDVHDIPAGVLRCGGNCWDAPLSRLPRAAFNCEQGGRQHGNRAPAHIYPCALAIACEIATLRKVTTYC